MAEYIPATVDWKSVDESDVFLFQQHASVLTKILADSRDKWYEIGIALKLPAAVIRECGGNNSGIVKLYKVLHKWLVGDYSGSVATTLWSLKGALQSSLVHKGVPASRLENEFKSAYTSLKLKGHSNLCEEHAQVLTEFLAEVAHQWEEIGIALQLPEYVLEECKREGSNAVKLHEILCKWLSGKFSCAVPGTLENLKLVIAGPLVRRSDILPRLRGSRFRTVVRLKPWQEELPDEITVYHPKYRSHLTRMYLGIKEVPTDWPPLGTTKFINLALIKSNEKMNCSDYSIRGDADDILATKEKVKYEDVFEQYEEGAIYLILGRPGGGKTTLVHKVVQDWANGLVMDKAELVFLISLRTFNIDGNDKHLVDVLSLHFHDEGMLKSLTAAIESLQGRGVCFIIDGLDEYQPRYKGASFVFALLDKRTLPRAMVVVSSRPAAATSLLQKKVIAKRIEVFGFTKKQILEYVDSFPFSEASEVLPQVDSKSVSLKNYLWSHRNVFDMCYLPVHAAMICFLYEESEDGNLPETQTRIYEYFTRMIILRHLIRNNECEKLESLEDLKGENRVSFMELCELAFCMTVDSEQVITPSHSISSLGLVTTDRTSNLAGFQKIYTFLHLTLQEFLAAYFLSILTFDKQYKFISQHSKAIHMLNVWKFYFGLVNFETHLDRVEKLFDGIHSEESFTVVQCAYESQRADICRQALRKNGFTFRIILNVSESDCAALAYVISAAAASKKYIEYLYFYNCGLNDEVIEAFVMHLDNDALCSLKEFKISYGNIGVSGARALAKALQQNSLTKVWISSSKLCADGANELVPRLKLVNELDIKGNLIGPDARNVFLKLNNFLSLQDLNLSDNNIGPVGAMALVDAWQVCCSLERLDLSDNNIGCKGAIALARLWQNGCALKELGLSHNNISCNGAIALAEKLQSDIRSGTNFCDATNTAATATLQSDCQLETLDLCQNDIGSCGASALFSTKLSVLDLSGNKIYLGSTSCNKCQKRLHDYIFKYEYFPPHLLRCFGNQLDLSENLININVAASILQELQSSSYKTIHLLNNPIETSDEGLSVLKEKMLSHQLVTLSPEENMIDHEPSPTFQTDRKKKFIVVSAKMIASIDCNEQVPIFLEALREVAKRVDNNEQFPGLLDASGVVAKKRRTVL